VVEAVVVVVAVVVLVVVVSVEVGVVVVVSVEGVVVVSVEGGAGSVAVEVLSVVLVTIETIPRAPEASIPAQSKAPSPRTSPARRSVFRPFISPAPLLPQIRRMNRPLKSLSQSRRAKQSNGTRLAYTTPVGTPASCPSPSYIAAELPRYRIQIVLRRTKWVPRRPSG